MKNNDKNNVSKGIIYITETIVDGLIKIGKTKTDNFDNRMYHLEHNGYCNVTGLKRRFAIEVDNYEEKETLLQGVFEKSRIGGTELFALNIDTAVQLLSSFEGKIIYPEEEKNKIFEEATEKIESRLLKDGIYTCKIGNYSAKVEIKNNSWTLLKGSVINIKPKDDLKKKLLPIFNSIKLNEKGEVLEDFLLGIVTPSFASNLVCGRGCNGWRVWKDDEGRTIDSYRAKNNNE